MKNSWKQLQGAFERCKRFTVQVGQAAQQAGLLFILGAWGAVPGIVYAWYDLLEKMAWYDTYAPGNVYSSARSFSMDDLNA